MVKQKTNPATPREAAEAAAEIGREQAKRALIAIEILSDEAARMIAKLDRQIAACEKAARELILGLGRRIEGAEGGRLEIEVRLAASRMADAQARMAEVATLRRQREIWEQVREEATK